MGIAREMIDAGLWLEGLPSIIHGHPSVESNSSFADLPYAQLGVPQYETERVLVVPSRSVWRFG